MKPFVPTAEDIKKFKIWLDYLRTLSEDGVIPLIEKQLLLSLDASLPFFSHFIITNRFPRIERLTINRRVVGSNKRIQNINHLKYPPDELVTKYGRCNLPGRGIFYGTFNELLSLNEMKPNIGDLVTISVWRAKGNESLRCCPVFKNPPVHNGVINPRMLELCPLYDRKLAEYPEFIRDPIDYLVRFIADSFVKEVSSANHLDYLFSAYFSNYMLYNFEDSTIDAIYYPSVQNNLSFENLAIKPAIFDKKYELIEVRDEVIVSAPNRQSPGYWRDGLGRATSFDYSAGKIFWEPNPLINEKLAIFKDTFGVVINE